MSFVTRALTASVLTAGLALALPLAVLVVLELDVLVAALARRFRPRDAVEHQALVCADELRGALDVDHAERRVEDAHAG